MDIERMVRHHIIQIITSDSASKINFSIEEERVDSVLFLNLSCALIFKGRIGIEFGSLPSYVEAAYDSNNNVFRFRNPMYGYEPLEKAAIVHESVHAAQDMTAGFKKKKNISTNSKRSTQEAAGYIAGALYYYYETGDFYINPKGEQPIFENARKIAAKIAAGSQSVSDDDALGLRKAVADHPGYKAAGLTLNAPTIMDGI